MTYDAQDILTERARPRAEAWRTAVGIALLATGTLALTALWVAVVPFFGIRGIEPGTTPAGMIWILSSFLCPMLTLWLVMQLLHHRSLLSLVGPLGPAVYQFGRVLMVQAAVLTLALILPSPQGMEPVAHLAFSRWLVWLGPAVVLLMVQIGAEELIFRGYLQSQLAARVRSPIVWLGLPAVLFALLHVDPSAGDNKWGVVGVTLLFALAAGDLTARTGTLGPALAMHLSNNFGALMLVGAKGPMQGLALYLMPVDMADPSLAPMLALEALLILVSWLGARIVLRV